MKRTTLLAIASAMMLAACSSEEIISNDAAEEVSVTYTVSLPEALATRAYSDGQTATYLTYGIYREGELIGSQLRKSQFADLKATVSLQLVKGYDYTIVFWADAGSACPYKIDLEQQTVTMDYATTSLIEGNDETRDAFYQVAEVTNLSTSISEAVEMVRPLAQLNFGANDLQADIIRENAPVSGMTFAVELPEGLPTVFNLADGSVEGETTEPITFVSEGVPAKSDGVFPVSGYDYVQMNYVLCEERVVLSNPVTLTASHANLPNALECTVKNVPLQRNYRTNIYGALLTDPVNCTVAISEAYDDHYCIKEGVLYYCAETAEELLEAIEAKQPTILLKNDMEVSEVITPSTATVLNLNGKELTVSGKTSISNTTHNASITSAKDLTIVDGALTLQKDLLVSDSATLTMEDVALSVGGSTGQVSGIYYISTSTESTVTNCTIDVTSTETVHAVSNIGDGAITLIGCVMNVECTEQDASGNNNAYGCSNKAGLVSVIDCELTVKSLYITQAAFNTDDGTMLFAGCKIFVESSGHDAYGIRNTGTGGFAILTSCDMTVISNETDHHAYGVSNGKEGSNERILVSDCTISTSNTVESQTHRDINNNNSSSWVGYINCVFPNSADTSEPVIGGEHSETITSSCTISIVQEESGKVTSMEVGETEGATTTLSGITVVSPTTTD